MLLLLLLLLVCPQCSRKVLHWDSSPGSNPCPLLTGVDDTAAWARACALAFSSGQTLTITLNRPSGSPRPLPPPPSRRRRMGTSRPPAKMVTPGETWWPLLYLSLRPFRPLTTHNMCRYDRCQFTVVEVKAAQLTTPRCTAKVSTRLCVRRLGINTCSKLVSIHGAPFVDQSFLKASQHGAVFRLEEMCPRTEASGLWVVCCCGVGDCLLAV